MTRQMLQEQRGKARFEFEECVNKIGDGLTAGIRLSLSLAILVLLGLAGFLGVLDEQMAERKLANEQFARVVE